MHTIEIDRLILEAEDGLMIGNGDLSVSIYQAADEIRWRFGKNDVWDRRLDLDACPRPAHIKEIARGIRDEGWVSHEYVYGDGEATKGAADPKRMKELCDGWPAYAQRPYPCPKPVGELALRWPADLSTPHIAQRVHIEKGEAEIEVWWDDGPKIICRCVVSAPPTNALVINWRVEDWNEKTKIGGFPPVWFSLYRWADPPVEQAAARLYKRARYKYYWGSIDSGACTPLPAPTVTEIAGRQVIEQQFYPDIEFADGFRYAMAPFTGDFEIEEVNTYNTGEAHMHLFREKDDVLSGFVGVAVPTSTDDGGVNGELRRVADAIGDDPAAGLKKLFEGAHAYADEFWSRSKMEMDDKGIEQCWYNTLHIRRSAYRGDVPCPGLALPSTVQDYSLWHGDYHMNFNFQQVFWGDYQANQIDLGDSYFPGMAHMVNVGRKIARDYWDCRGTFIQLAGYPFPVADDPYGTGALARMAYMTGWVTNHYWRRYLYTVDKDWLAEVGYPVIRDGALFYTDWLEKWDDGKYHAFPSCQGESYYTGKVEDYLDQPQVIRHIQYCLRSAIKAAEALDVDPEHRAEWQDRLDNLVVVDDLDALGFSEEEKHRYRVNPPAFVAPDAGTAIPRGKETKPWLTCDSTCGMWAGGVNMMPWWAMIRLHNRIFRGDLDVPGISGVVGRWMIPGGALRAMGVGSHSYIGGYGESLGIIAPIQEMLLQSWDGVIRIFPDWAPDIDARFETLRAEGAFLVTAAQRGGVAQDVSMTSEKGQPCRIESPWPGGMTVLDESGKPVETSDEDNIYSFDTTPGAKYELRAK